jgi:hypothetical protein
MHLRPLSTTELAAIVAFVLIVAACIVVLFYARKRRTEKLRSKFGGAEYARAVEAGGNQRHAEAGLEERKQRVEGFHVRPLALNDRARFVESWRKIQSRFVDGPASSVTEADQLLGDVMSARGYPISDFQQRAEDISVDHPLVMENYRTAHEIALRQTKGEADTEDLRRAMIHYRTLFEELVGDSEVLRAQAAS